MNVFVTGATGLLGSNMVRELLSEGHNVTALVRTPSKASALFESDTKLEFIHGDLQNIPAFDTKLQETDALIHAAACYTEYYASGDKKRTFDVNVGGTVSLLKAAYGNGIKNVVYISSAGVLDTGSQSPLNEQSPYADGIDDSYFQSKVMAEKEVMAFGKAIGDLRLITLLPTVMLGPYDKSPTPTGGLILKLLKGKMKFVLPGFMRIVDARDVARAVVSSLEKGVAGERYVLGGNKHSFAEIYSILGDVTGIPVPTKTASPLVLMNIARIMTLVSKFTGKPPALKPSIVKRLTSDFSYDSNAAKKDLGIEFRPLRQTLEDTAGWMQNALEQFGEFRIKP